MIRIIDLCAAGGFVGFTTRLATEAELESVERAKAIRDAGRMMLGSEDREDNNWIN
jgi:tRNA1(Val) A37 N6-methylase TrmN6